MKVLRQYLRFLAAVQLLPALESGQEEILVGGQAVLEGVMMRSPHAWGIAVRKSTGEIMRHSEPLERPSDKHKWMAWPVVRGVMTLGQAMSLGFKALRYSANVALDETPINEEGKTIQISSWMIAVNAIFSIAFFIFMYKYLPLLAATGLKNAFPVFSNQIMFNLVDGVIRIAMFLLSSGAYRFGRTSVACTSTTAPNTKPFTLSSRTIRCKVRRSKSIQRSIRAAAPAS